MLALTGSGLMRRAVSSAFMVVAPGMRAALVRQRAASAHVQRVLRQFPRVNDAVVALVVGDARERYERWIAAYDTLDDGDLAAIRAEVALTAGELASLTVVVPCTASEAGVPRRLAESLREQLHDRCDVVTVRADAADEWNEALRAAPSDFVAVVDEGYVLRPHSLFLVARACTEPGLTLVYADEDEIDDAGRRSNHDFKPEWNPSLLRGRNYLGGLVVFRRAAALAAGGCEPELDGDCLWGLLLRLTAHLPATAIGHVPFILSQRVARAQPRHDFGERARIARAAEQRLARVGDTAAVRPIGNESYRVQYALPAEHPTVSVIVPTTGTLDLLRPCVDGVLTHTSYGAIELLVVASASRALSSEQGAYFDALAADSRVRILFHDARPYNFAETINWAAGQASGELLCFLNDDTRVITDYWLPALVSHVLRDRVGAAGAMLLYPNGRIQHAGVVLGLGGVGAHIYRGRRRSTSGYHERALVATDLTCVTAACMVVRGEAFEEVDGFDEDFSISYNDVDLCLRLNDAGWRVLWTPDAELFHMESASLGPHDADDTYPQWLAEWSLIRERWGDRLNSDPAYSPNLSLDPLQAWEPAFPPRVTYPWRQRRSAQALA